MEFVQIGESLKGFVEGEERASVTVIEQNGIVHLKDLRAEGYFMDIVERLRQMNKGKTVRIVVQHNDGWEKLLHAYTRFGFSPIGIVMEMEVS